MTRPPSIERDTPAPVASAGLAERLPWRVRAAAAYGQAQRDQHGHRAAMHADAARRLADRLTDLLGEPIAVVGEHIAPGPTPECPRITINGVTFTVRWDGFPHGAVVVVGHCPRCHGEAESAAIANLAMLGKELSSFAPGYGHRCSDLAPVMTDADRLWAALADYLDERIESALSGRCDG